MARFVIHEEAIDDVDTTQVMSDLADAIVVDAKALAAKGKTGHLEAGIRVAQISEDRVVIESRAENPRSSEGHKEYPWWVEKGTKRSKARPYFRPAVNKYRT